MRWWLLGGGCAALTWAGLRWSPLPGQPLLDATSGLALAALLVWRPAAPAKATPAWLWALAVTLGCLFGRWAWAAGQPLLDQPVVHPRLWPIDGLTQGLTQAAQALLGAWLLRRQAADPLALAEPREVLRFFLAAGAWPALLGGLLTTLSHALTGAELGAPLLLTGLNHGIATMLGMMVVAPMALAWLGRPRDDWAPRRWPIGLAGLLSVLLVHLGVAGVASAELRRDQTEFDRSAQHAMTLLDAELQAAQHALQSIQVLFAASEEVTANEFHVATAGWLAPHQALSALGWAECASAGGSARSGSGPALSARYVEPLAEVAPGAIGSVSSAWLNQPAAATAAAQALRLGRSVMSGSLPLGPSPNETSAANRAVLLFLPVRNELLSAEAPVLAEEVVRKDARAGCGIGPAARGVVFAAVSLAHLWAPLVESLPAPLALCLVDGAFDRPPDTARTLLAGTPGCDTRHARLRQAQTLAAAGRNWTLVLVDPAPLSGSEWSPTALLGSVGMACSALLVALLLVVTGRARRIELAVAEAQAARRSAEGASRAKNAFLSRMSHELRTPLNAVLGFAQLLEMAGGTEMPPPQRRWAAQIRQAGEHLLAMINEILDLSRIESDTLSLSIEPLSVQALVNDVVGLVEQRAGQRQIALNIDLAPGADWLRGDATRVRQILTNLLTNAIKYNRDGGQVDVQARRSGAQVEIDVRDNGLGMTLAQLGQLFQPFNRLGRENTGVEGTGIGLVISRRLATLMGGELRVVSEPELGSTFTLVLPVPHPLTGSLTGSLKSPQELAR